MVAQVGSTVFVTDSTSPLSGSAVTIPGGALGVLVFWGFDAGTNGSTLSSISCTGTGTFTIAQNVPTVAGSFERCAGVAYADVTSTGAKTFSATYSANPSQGVIFAFVFVDAAIIADGLVRGSGGDNTSGSAALAVSANSTATSLVVGCEAKYNAVPAAPSGWTSIGSAGAYNGEGMRVCTANSPGASTTTYTAPAPDYSAAVVIALGVASSSPTLSSGSAAATGNGTASGTATTTGADGTMYAVRSAAQPTNAQIVAGQDSTGAASSAGSLAITSAGAKTIPLTGVAVPTGSQTVWFLHRPAAGAGSDSNVISAAWTQPTAATLSSPTNTPGSTTALVGCTTNTTSGTLYALARVGGSAASASTIVATGQTATVSTTTPSKTYTGLTASTSNYYVDMVQGVGVTTSNVVTTGPFTTSASGDTTAPTLTGSIVIGTVSSTTIQMSWTAGSDNVAVTSYEVSKDSGTNWTDVGNVLTYTFTGLTASTSYGLRVRAKDAAGNVSTPALAATQSTSAAGGVGSINLNNAALYVFKKNNATTIASTSVTFWVSDVTTGALVGSAITGLATNTSGLVTTAISNASMVAGTTYRLNYEFSSGEYGCVKLPAV